MTATKPVRRGTRAWAVLAPACLLILLVACRGGTPEERLRAQFSAMQAAVEEKRTADFMRGVSADFTGTQGMDRGALHNLLRARTLGHAGIGIVTGPLEVEVQGDNAIVRFRVLLTGGDNRWLPEQASRYQVTSAWRLEDGEWRVHYAQWR